MTASPNLASERSAEARSTPTPSGGPYVLNLCSSSTPMALAQTELPELKRFTFFVSRRFEEGRERFRLHMGHFATLAEAEEWLSVVRDIYPGAWAGEAPGRKLRERAAAAAAAQAQYAAGPHTPARASPAARTPRPESQAAVPAVAASAPAPAQVPVVHAAPPLPQATAHTVKASAPHAAAPATAKLTHGAPPIPQAAPPAAEKSLKAAQAGAPAVPAAARAVPAPQAAAARPAAAPAQPVHAAAKPVAAAKAPAPAPKPAAAAPRPPAITPKPAAAAPSAPPVGRLAPAAAKSAAAPAAASGASVRRGAKPVKPVFEDSNVREVLKALADQHAGETREMQALPAPPAAAAPVTNASSLSDTQVLKMLEARRAEHGQPLPIEGDTGNIPMLKPDDTGTRRALKDALTSNAPVAFAVQLQWSVQPPDLESVPPLAIFSAYTLYTVEGSRDGRKWYGLRLGFFTDAISAKQVAHYVRSEFASVAVVPVSPGEKARASDQEIAATLAAPVPARPDPMDEFKLIDEAEAARAAAAAQLPARVPYQPKAKVPVGRALRAADASRTVGARERRGPHTLEETLEILGAGQLSIDNGNGTTLNDSGVRHLRVEVQKNSPFSRLLERLSERLKKS